MTDIIPVPNWGGVRQLETNEFATGGANGNMNEQAKALAGQNMYSRLYAGLPFDPVFTDQVGGFPAGGRAALENGDIVRSTVANNSTNPNINMTGWFVPYMRGSQNLVELTDKATSRSNLDVYSKGEALAKNNNLSELSDKATARTNLDVYSKVETNANIASAAATPNATETTAGKAKIATTAIAQAGTNDADFLTAKKLRDALNTTGDAPVYAIRAIAQGNSNAVSPVFTRKLNISTASKINGLVLSFTFTTAMPDNNYTVLGFGGDQAIGVEGSSGGLIGFDQTTTGFKVKYSFATQASSQSINSFRLVVL